MPDRPSVTRAVADPAPPPGRAGAPPPPDPPTRRTARRRGGWRPLLLRLHFYAGLFVAPFLLVAAVTGLAYTTMPQVEAIVHRDVLTVPASERTVPLAQQVQAARAAHPEGSIAAITPAPTSTDSTRVKLAVDGMGDYGRTVFVDPHTGTVLGAERTFGDFLPVRAWFDELHRTLHLGDTGRLYSELAASWLWVIALGGVALWFGRRRGRRKAAGKPTGRRRLVGLHTTIGLTVVLGLLVLSATGMTWSKHAGSNISDLRAQFDQGTPVVDTGPAAEAGEHAGHAGHGGAGAPTDMSGLESERLLDLDRVAAAGAAAGFSGPVDITLPASAEGEFAVKENTRQWPVRQDSIAVDGESGQVTDSLAFADWPVGAKLARWGIDAHMGLLFGLANQIVLAVIALGLIALIVLGYRMWFKRRPTRGRALGGKPFPRGAWRHVPLPLLALAIAVTALVGWFVPLLGISLLAFLAIDAVFGLRAARRRA